MASTPVTAGNTIKPSSNGLNDLFTRINTLRAKHYTASQSAGSSTTGITSEWTTRVETDEAASAASVSTLNDQIRAVGASGSFTANNTSTRYATEITVPSVASLIRATDFNAWDTVITNMENVCAHYSRYSSFYSSRYSSFYSSFYSGQYGTNYSSRYSSFYGSRYGSRYSNCLAKGTKILLKDNEQKEIENINIGDEVIVWNESAQKQEIKKVIDKTEHMDVQKIIKLHLSNGTNLMLTPGHPILTEKGWASLDKKVSLEVHGVYARELQIGDIIIGLNEKTRLIKIEELDNGPYICYNLSVDKIHNVIALTNGENPSTIIAHNKKVCITSIC